MERSTNTSRLMKAQTKKVRGTTVADYKKGTTRKVEKKLELGPKFGIGKPARTTGGWMPTPKNKKTNKVWRSRLTKRTHRRNRKNK